MRELTKKLTYPCDAGSPINLFGHETILEFLESPLALVHKHDSASGQGGKVFDWSGEIDYTPLRSTRMEVSQHNPRYPSKLWVEQNGERRVERYRIFFDATKGVERDLNGKKVREYDVHFRSELVKSSS